MVVRRPDVPELNDDRRETEVVLTHLERVFCRFRSRVALCAQLLRSRLPLPGDEMGMRHDLHPGSHWCDCAHGGNTSARDRD